MMKMPETKVSGITFLTISNGRIFDPDSQSLDL